MPVVVAMSFQGYQEDVNPQGGHDVSGAEEGPQKMRLAQAQIAQIVSSAVSSALTQYLQHTAINSPHTATSTAAAVRQV